MSQVDVLEFGAGDQLDWGTLATEFGQWTSAVPWTVLAFVKASSLAARTVLYAKWGAGGQRWAADIREPGANNRFQINSNTISLGISSGSENAVTDVWLCLMLRCDGANSASSLTFNLVKASDGTSPNGVGDGQVVSSALISTSSGFNAAPVTFGENDIGTQTFNGQACLWALLSESISDAEFTSYRTDPLNTVEAWKLTKQVRVWHPEIDISGGFLLDDSGGARNATLTGASLVAGVGPDVPEFSAPDIITASDDIDLEVVEDVTGIATNTLDDVRLALVESAAIASTLARTDEVSLSLTEVQAVSINNTLAKSASDDVNIAVSDASLIAVTIAATDTADISVSDASTVDIPQTAITASDDIDLEAEDAGLASTVPDVAITASDVMDLRLEDGGTILDILPVTKMRFMPRPDVIRFSTQ